MNEQLRQRILRRLETLGDERAYQILDYIEFLESKYAERAAPTNLIAKITESIEDTMRAARLPLKAISGTTGLVESAGKVMKGVAAAAESVVSEALGGGGDSPEKKEPKPPAPTAPPAPPAPPA